MSATTKRRRLLFGALAVTLVLSAASGGEWQSAGEPVLPVQEPERLATRPSAPAQPRVELERVKRDAASGRAGPSAGHAFRAMSWYVPPPPTPPPRPPPPPPPPPTAPPLPFSFLGRYVEDASLIILLVRGDRIYTVSEGEVIDNTYRVERLSGGQLELTYLPLNIRQTLDAGDG